MQLDLEVLDESEILQTRPEALNEKNISQIRSEERKRVQAEERVKQITGLKNAIMFMVVGFLAFTFIRSGALRDLIIVNRFIMMLIAMFVAAYSVHKTLERVFRPSLSLAAPSGYSLRGAPVPKCIRPSSCMVLSVPISKRIPEKTNPAETNPAETNPEDANPEDANDENDNGDDDHNILNMPPTAWEDVPEVEEETPMEVLEDGADDTNVVD